MRYIILIFTISFCLNLFSQSQDSVVFKANKRAAAKAQFICIWGDKKYMTLHTNGLIYTFKSGLEDGRYTAFYDKKYTDSAMTVTFENGKMNGILKRWDDEDLKIAEKVQYENGLMDGYRVLYFFDPEGNEYQNIELFEEGLPVKTIKSEW